MEVIASTRCRVNILIRAMYPSDSNTVTVFRQYLLDTIQTEIPTRIAKFRFVMNDDNHIDSQIYKRSIR